MFKTDPPSLILFSLIAPLLFISSLIQSITNSLFPKTETPVLPKATFTFASVTSTPIPSLTPVKTTFLTPTPSPTSTPIPTKAVILEKINLTNWKLTLPIGSDKRPTEIKQSQLTTYQLAPFFIILPENSGVRFRAPVNGVTTSNSGYPRSELREMANGGSSNANWSSTSGTHSLFLDQAITKVPQTKKHVVAGQVHDSEDDIIVIRLEYPNLYVNVDGKNLFTLDSNYTLGKRFTVKFEVNNGKTKVYYNKNTIPSYVLDKAYLGAYFKAGAYTQSNCSKEAASLCNSENYGEVIIYQAVITHQ